jgi:cytochrome P450
MMTEPFTFPTSRGECPFAPSAVLTQMRRETPVRRITLWDGSRPWLITRHADVRAVLRDPRFSSATHHPGFPWVNEGLKAQSAGGSQPFIRLDGPEHARLRNLLVADFTPRRAEALRPQIQLVVDECLDRMIAQGTPSDLLAELALPLPSLIICELLGVDDEDREFFRARTMLLTHTTGEPEQLEQALDELVAYLLELVKRKRAAPDESIVSRLAASAELNDQEVAVTSMFLLIAGHETTANQITMSTLALFRNPEQLAVLRAQPALMKGAVEELLRYAAIVHSGAPRVATEEVSVSGQLISAGDGVLCALDTANHDDQAFVAPDDMTVTRETRSHVAFGFGLHQCLGISLARAELQVTLETVLRRLPHLRLAVPFEQLRFKEDGAVYGVHELPVIW